MGSSQTRTGAVPESSSEINEGIVRGVFERVGGRSTPLGQAIQVAPGGKQLEKRFAGDINLPAFFGSKDEAAGTSGGSYTNVEAAKPVTKSLRGKYLGQGADSLSVEE